MSEDPDIKWIPVNDGHGIVGYHWQCQCGELMTFASPGDECPKCDSIIPDIDPDDWMEKIWQKAKLIPTLNPAP